MNNKIVKKNGGNLYIKEEITENNFEMITLGGNGSILCNELTEGELGVKITGENILETFNFMEDWNEDYSFPETGFWNEFKHDVRTGLAQTKYSLGDEFITQYTLSGAPKNITLRIIGFNQDKITGMPDKNTVTLESKEILFKMAFGIYSSPYKADNEWGLSPMRDFLNGPFYKSLNADFRKAISSIDKWTVVPKYLGKTAQLIDGRSSVNTSDKVFLLSTKEIGVVEGYTPYVEKETIYQFYESNQVENRKKKFSGVLSPWWLRSPNVTQIAVIINIHPSLRIVPANGGLTTTDHSYSNNYDIGVSPAFVIG